MKFTDLFVKRPVLAIVVNIVILIAGLQAIRSLSVRQYPRSDIAVVQVTTVYTGANADLVRGFITTPLERVIASADGIDYMESSSAQGLSTITVHLKLNYDTNAALTQIIAHLGQFRLDLRQRGVGVIVELQVHGDCAQALSARRLHVIDAVGARDHTLQRGGDEAANQVRVGAHVHRRDLHHRDITTRILTDAQRTYRLQTCNQDY